MLFLPPKIKNYDSQVALCIPVGYVPPSSMAATRCQYLVEGVSVPFDRDSLDIDPTLQRTPPPSQRPSRQRIARQGPPEGMGTRYRDTERERWIDSCRRLLCQSCFCVSVFKIRLIILGFLPQKTKIPVFELTTYRFLVRSLNHYTMEPTVRGRHIKAFSSLQSCLTDSS